MNTKPVSVLWLAPFLPWPLVHGGAVRMYNMIRYLSERYEITLLALVEKSSDLEGVKAFDLYCKSVRTVMRPDRPVFSPLRIAPPAVFLDDVPEMHRVLQLLQRTHHFDILQIEYANLSTYLKYRNHSKTILTEYDVSYVSAYRRFRTEHSWPLKLRRWMGFITFFYYELRHLGQYDNVITMSEYDRVTLQKWLPNLPITVVPNGVDSEAFTVSPDRPKNESLLFVGNFKHPPNVDGIQFFMQDVWPLLHRQFPNLLFFIVGADPPTTIQEMASENVIVTGRVSNLQEYYTQASVVVVSVRFGSGTRIKILEAFAAGSPVVSTSLGIEGIDAEPDRHYLKADSASTFIAQITRLLRSDKLQRDLLSNARRLVEEKYDWKILAQRQGELYEQILTSKSRG